MPTEPAGPGATPATDPSEAGRVAFLGPEGTFSGEAARQVAPGASAEAQPTIADVIDAVRAGEVGVGVVPLENSIEGSVTLALDALAFGEPGVYIRGEVLVPIAMNLLVRPGVSAADVDTLVSHSQALGQCREWVAANLPKAETRPSISTADAAREVSESDGSVAALGTRVAAETYGLTVAASGIADYEGNTTRFVTLGRSMAPATGADKTSIVFLFGPDLPGQLHRVLDEFALRGINLTKIESRPSKQRLGRYAFFIDCAGHVSEARIGEALRGVHRHTARLRVLGSYPRADGPGEQPPQADTEAAYGEAEDWYRDVLSDVSTG